MEQQVVIRSSESFSDCDSTYSADDDDSSQPSHDSFEDVDRFLELEAALANSIYQCVQLIRQRHTNMEEHSIAERRSFERLYTTKADLLNLYHICEMVIHHDAFCGSPTLYASAQALHAEEDVLLRDMHNLHRLVWQGHFLRDDEQSELEDMLEQNLPWGTRLQQQGRKHDSVSTVDLRRSFRQPEDFLMISFKIIKLRNFLKTVSGDLRARGTDSRQIASAQRSRSNNEAILAELDRSFELQEAKAALRKPELNDGAMERVADEGCQNESCWKEQQKVIEMATRLQPLCTAAVKHAEENHKLRESLLRMREERDYAIARGLFSFPTPPEETDVSTSHHGGDVAAALGDYYRSSISSFEDPSRWSQSTSTRRDIDREKETLEQSKKQQLKQLAAIEAGLVNFEAQKLILETRERKVAADEERLRGLDVTNAAKSRDFEEELATAPQKLNLETRERKSTAGEERARGLNVPKAAVFNEFNEERPKLPQRSEERARGIAVAETANFRDFKEELAERPKLPQQPFPETREQKVAAGKERLQESAVAKAAKSRDFEDERPGPPQKLILETRERKVAVGEERSQGLTGAKAAMFTELKPEPLKSHPVQAVKKPISKIDLLKQKYEAQNQRDAPIPRVRLGDRQFSEPVKTSVRNRQRSSLPRPASQLNPINLPENGFTDVSSPSSRVAPTVPPANTLENGLAEPPRPSYPASKTQNSASARCRQGDASDQTPKSLPPYPVEQGPLQMPGLTSQVAPRVPLATKGGLSEGLESSSPASNARNLPNRVPGSLRTGYRAPRVAPPYPVENEGIDVSELPSQDASSVPFPTPLNNGLAAGPKTSAPALEAQKSARESLEASRVTRQPRPPRSLFPAHGSLSPVKARPSGAHASKDDSIEGPSAHSIQRNQEPAENESYQIRERRAKLPVSNGPNLIQGARSDSAGLSRTSDLPYPVYAEDIRMMNDRKKVESNYSDSRPGHVENSPYQDREESPTTSGDEYHNFIQKVSRSSSTKVSDLPPLVSESEERGEKTRDPGFWRKYSGKWKKGRNQDN